MNAIFALIRILAVRAQIGGKLVHIPSEDNLVMPKSLHEYVLYSIRLCMKFALMIP
jgi:hypothetical protein